MRTIIAILFMLLATQVSADKFTINEYNELIGDYLLPLPMQLPSDLVSLDNPTCSEEKQLLADDLKATKHNLDLVWTKLKNKYRTHDAVFNKQKQLSERLEKRLLKSEVEIEKITARYVSTMQEAVKINKYLDQCREQVEKLTNYGFNHMNLMEIVSSNTGVENDIISTLQVIKGDFNKLSKNERLELQLVLKARGMYQAELDGAWGKYSRIAFAMYLGPKLQLSSAKNTEELFSEIKKGFIIENLWEREDFEKELQEIWRTDAKNKLTSGSGISSGSRSSSSSRSTADDDSFEPFFKQMYINNELKNCLKVGNTWECD